MLSHCIKIACLLLSFLLEYELLECRYYLITEVFSKPCLNKDLDGMSEGPVWERLKGS